MKRVRHVALAAALTTIALMPGTGTAQEAGDVPAEVVEAVVNAEASVMAHRADLDVANVAEDGADATVAGVAVDLPADSTGTITLTDATGTAVGMTLPDETAAEAVPVTDGMVAYETHEWATAAVVVKDDGSVQVATVLENTDAPTRLTYNLTVPAGGSLTKPGSTVELLAVMPVA